MSDARGPDDAAADGEGGGHIGSAQGPGRLNPSLAHHIANTLGWMTAELGRQPWLIYGLFRTRDGYSKVVSNGDTIFTDRPAFATDLSSIPAPIPYLWAREERVEYSAVGRSALARQHRPCR